MGRYLYNWRWTITVSSLFGKITQVDTFKASEGVIHWPQKDVNNVVKRDGKVSFYNQVYCWYVFSPVKRKPVLRQTRLICFSTFYLFAKITEKKVRKTRFKSHTWTVYDLGDLLWVKTAIVQMNKYEHVLGYKSIFYWRHQSFLKMKLNNTKVIGCNYAVN